MKTAGGSWATKGRNWLAAQAAVAVEAAGAAGNSQLQDGLCDVDPNESIVHVDSSFIAVTSSDSGTSMPFKSQEESIPSLQRTRPGFAWSLAAELGVGRTLRTGVE
jgi:hypothetical protein